MNRNDPQPIERVLGAVVCLACLAIGIAVGLVVRMSTAEGSLAARHEAVAALSAAEKDRLKRRYARFAKLDANQQQRLRELHRELESAQDADSLRDVMSQYHEWLKFLSPAQRAELLQLADDPDKRLQRVIAWRPLPDKDRLAVWDWARNRIGPRLLAELPEAYREKWKNRDAASLVWQWFFDWRRSGEMRKLRLVKLTDEDLEDLSVRLSDRPREALEFHASAEEKVSQVRRWIMLSLSRREGDSPTPKTREEELVRFFLSDEFTDPQREQLLSMPLPERNRRLREKYYQAKRPGSGPAYPGRGEVRPGPGNRPDRKPPGGKG